MFDSHCHLDADEYDPDRTEVLARAEAAGVCGVMVPGYEPSEWRELRGLCALHPMLCCGVGLHPWYVHELSESSREAALAGLADALREAGAVAIGECGLDAKKAKAGGAAMALQEHVLEVHLELARSLDMPVILHCVDAHGRMLELLERKGPLVRGGVLHSYSGPAELIPRYEKLNLSFSFAGVITRQVAKRPRRALASVPLERLLLESDGPDQAAFGVEPRRSEPAHVAHVLRAAAELRNASLHELAHVTTQNALRLFGLGGTR